MLHKNSFMLLNILCITATICAMDSMPIIHIVNTTNTPQYIYLDTITPIDAPEATPKPPSICIKPKTERIFHLLHYEPEIFIDDYETVLKKVAAIVLWDDLGKTKNIQLVGDKKNSWPIQDGGRYFIYQDATKGLTLVQCYPH